MVRDAPGRARVARQDVAALARADLRDAHGVVTVGGGQAGATIHTHTHTGGKGYFV